MDIKDSVNKEAQDASSYEHERKINAKPAKKKRRFVNTLEEILQEDPDIIEDEHNEKTEPDNISGTERVKHKKNKKTFHTILGAVLTFFAVIGLFVSFKFAFLGIKNFSSGSGKKDEFTNVIYPAVLMDIVSFDSPSQLPNDQIISVALWSLIMSQRDMQKYEQTFDVISVPAIDVESYAANLFDGELPQINHETVGVGELKFYYNEESKSYNVPVNPITFTYMPNITSISKDGDDYVVSIDYLKEVPQWMEDNIDYSDRVSKTVEIQLHEENDKFKIKSLSVIKIYATI